MKHFKLALLTAFSIGNLVLAGLASASSQTNLPPIETQGGIRYMTGGIGSGESSAMEHVESHYPLSLEFAEHAKPHDEFLADVNVTIKDQAGHTALKTKSDGPFLFADVPNGKYVITASDMGKRITRRIDVASGKPDHLVFVW